MPRLKKLQGLRKGQDTLVYLLFGDGSNEFQFVSPKAVPAKLQQDLIDRGWAETDPSGTRLRLTKEALGTPFARDKLGVKQEPRRTTSSWRGYSGDDRLEILEAFMKAYAIGDRSAPVDVFQKGDDIVVTHDEYGKFLVAPQRKGDGYRFTKF